MQTHPQRFDATTCVAKEALGQASPSRRTQLHPYLQDDRPNCCLNHPRQMRSLHLELGTRRGKVLRLQLIEPCMHEQLHCQFAQPHQSLTLNAGEKVSSVIRSCFARWTWKHVSSSESAQLPPHGGKPCTASSRCQAVYGITNQHDRPSRPHEISSHFALKQTTRINKSWFGIQERCFETWI